MKIAIVVPGGLHPSGQEQVVPSWLALFERLSPAIGATRPDAVGPVDALSCIEDDAPREVAASRS